MIFNIFICDILTFALNPAHKPNQNHLLVRADKIIYYFYFIGKLTGKYSEDFESFAVDGSDSTSDEV